MEAFESIKILATHAHFELHGTIPFETAAEKIFKAVAFCCENRIKLLLIDVRDVQGIGHLTTTQRYWFSTEAAKNARGSVRIAMVLRPEFADPQKFGVTVAANRNLIVDIFLSESDALNWLLAGPSE